MLYVEDILNAIQDLESLSEEEQRLLVGGIRLKLIFDALPKTHQKDPFEKLEHDYNARAGEN